MEPRDRQRFGAAITAMMGHYGRTPTELSLTAYWGAVRDIPIEDAERACVAAIHECEFPPSGKRLAELAQDGPSAAEAWETVTTAIQRLGSYQWEVAKERLGPRVWEATARVGGFRHLCGMTIFDLERVGRGDFARAYASGGAQGGGQLQDGAGAESLDAPRPDGLTRALPGGGAVPT